ncbi:MULTISPECIES: hypothetical protein [Gracilibacillus]|uniref:hypothetical protein n=1 Tax=Gracilibacillus TaxID=74385 RepID=UPI0006D226FF
MKEIVTTLLILFASLILLVSYNARKSNSSTQTKARKMVPIKDFAKMYRNPQAYYNHQIILTAKVIKVIENNKGMTYLPVYTTLKKEQNLLIYIKQTKLNVKVNNTIRVVGIIRNQYEGRGKKELMIAPLIEAISIEVLD